MKALHALIRMLIELALVIGAISTVNWIIGIALFLLFLEFEILWIHVIIMQGLGARHQHEPINKTVTKKKPAEPPRAQDGSCRGFVYVPPGERVVINLGKNPFGEED